MARLHDDSDDDLPELSTVMAHYARKDPRRSLVRTTGAAIQEQGQEMERKSEKKDRDASHDKIHVRRQRPLGLVHVNSLLLSIPSSTSKLSQTSARLHPTDKTSIPAGATPRRIAKLAIDYGDRALSQSSSLCLSDGDLFDVMSDLTVKEVPDEDHYQRPRSLGKWVEKQTADTKMAAARTTLTDSRAPSLTSAASMVSPMASSLELVQAAKPSDLEIRLKLHAAASSVHENVFPCESSATLKQYLRSSTECMMHADAPLSSPPRSRSPSKCTEGVCFTTPPPSPSKSRLQSPKKQQSIPPSPHRPSIDAFWSQHIVNDWNDEYSPRKFSRSGRLRPMHSVTEDDNDEFSPSTFPRRSPVKAPVGKDRKALGARRAFNEKKHGLAQEFLKELDDVVANGKVASLAASGGGIRLIWSKKLSSTAGRANWRQEVIRSKENGDLPCTSYRHHASIELAEKVIDDEGRYTYDTSSYQR